MKNLKKFLSLIMAFVFVVTSVCVVSADKSFLDLNASHWGYSYINTLVNDGTINGYADGKFRPEANVTRAEFVKMIGKTNKSFDSAFDDINGHWAYEYIMYSDMDVSGNNFYPDVAITRGDVVGLLWKRAGSPKAYAPSIITNQSSNPDAAAWAYAYGIMNGDDGITMRLDDGVTRAEAAALIVRSRNIDKSVVKDFSTTVNPEILKKVYESFRFLDEYDPDKTFTNGEIATLAFQLLYEATTPMLDDMDIDLSINRIHGITFSAACKYVWGSDRKNEEFYEKTANNIDSIAVLTFAIANKSFANIVDYSTDDFYADVNSVHNDYMNIYVSGAHKSGVRLDNSDNIYPNKDLTGKNLALLLLQLDALGGFSSSYIYRQDSSFPMDTPLRTEISTYPSNSDKYQLILDEVPNAVYNSDFIDTDGTVCTSLPKDTFKLARDNSELFGYFITNISCALSEAGVDAVITFYPSLVCETKRSFMMKVKVKVVDYEDGKTFDDIFPNIIDGEKPDLKDLPTFYATLASGGKFVGIDIPIDNATFTSIDYIY